MCLSNYKGKYFYTNCALFVVIYCRINSFYIQYKTIESVLCVMENIRGIDNK